MMKIGIHAFLGVMLILLDLYPQVINNYKFNDNFPDRSGLVGNGITDLLYRDTILYAGSGFGLSLTKDEGKTWRNITADEHHGEGGITALAVSNEGTIWIAAGYDTTVETGESLSAGGGLSYLIKESSEWVFIPQPIDTREDTTGGKKPTTTHVQNITFDIAVLDTQVWIASWGGGIRRSLDMGETWDVITTDGKPFSSLDYLNHRGFSALAENGNIWIGTADGISKSMDGGETWDRFFVKNQEPEQGGLSGGWIIDLAFNPWNRSVWAVSLSTGGNEFHSIARTKDGGTSWTNFLIEELSDGTFARDISFYENTTYVATEKGVYKSVDDGESWFLFPAIEDKVSGEYLLTSKFYSVVSAPITARQDFHRLWLGSADGLATTINNGYDWTIFRGFVSTRERMDPAVYAYPNPFSPARENFVRFQYDITTAGHIKIDIYNFAMEKVVHISKNEPSITENTYDRSVNWNGRDINGRLVDNGVYFFRAEIEGVVTWGKIVVIN